MAKALQVFTCVFTNTPPTNGVFNVDGLTALNKNCAMLAIRNSPIF